MKINYVLFFMLAVFINQDTQASTAGLRRSAATIYPALYRGAYAGSNFTPAASYSQFTARQGYDGKDVVQEIENLDGSKETRWFNKDGSLRSTFIEFPNGTSSHITYGFGNIPESESFTDDSGDKSYVFYNTKGQIKGESKNTKHPKGRKSWNQYGDLEYATIDVDGIETTDFYYPGPITYWNKGPLVKSRTINDEHGKTYSTFDAYGNMDYQKIDNPDGSKKTTFFNPDGSIESQRIYDNFGNKIEKNGKKLNALTENNGELLTQQDNRVNNSKVAQPQSNFSIFKWLQSAPYTDVHSNRIDELRDYEDEFGRNSNGELRALD